MGGNRHSVDAVADKEPPSDALMHSNKTQGEKKIAHGIKMAISATRFIDQRFRRCISQSNHIIATASS
jgi:hypothetical protein